VEIGCFVNLRSSNLRDDAILPKLLLSVSFGAVTVLWSGCVGGGSSPSLPVTPVPATFAAAGQSTSPVAGQGWLDDFGDPRLKALVAEAWRRNPDLYTAAGVYQESAAAAQAAAATLYPQFNGKGSSRYTDNDGVSSRDYSVGLEVSWEVDLWGKLRSDRAFAQKVAQSAGLDYLQARHSLAAAVAEAYFAAIAAEEQLAIDRLRLESEKETAQITRQRVDAGLGSSLERDLGNANVNLAEATVKDDLSALAEAKRFLEVIPGRYPASSISAARSDLPQLPGGRVALGIPAALLERRPDVRSAELLVDAAYENVKSARAARLPALTLSAGVRSLIDPATFISQVASSIVAPIADGGRLAAREAVATAQQKQTLGQYASVALDAFREVEGALSNERYLAERERELATAASRLRNARQASEGRYEAGVTPILDLQQVRTRDFQTRSQLLGVRFERLRQRLLLYRALGGEVFSEGSSQWENALAREFESR
jgi:NodT family efflux transporter outer membrane factor (OMF) lipoprotein